MIQQLLVGSLVIVATIVVTSGFFVAAIHALSSMADWLSRRQGFLKTTAVLAAVTLWLFGALTVAVWIWALVYLATGVFDALGPALYFSVVAFTTLGFGDIIPPTPWRILAGVCAANGLILFGLTTAFLVEVFKRLHGVQTGHPAPD